ncbi:hypothetical protein [uncultured Mediterranean phage uvMED]|nr:hypothetical protein [uncultured Mediterranean phage uvMED]BAQ86756.1 hypothetical protein [uncultured Mediterranean phage uvMED]
MGFLKPKKYVKPASEVAFEKQMEEERIAAEKEKEELAKAAEQRKKRFAAGKIGSRSLFARAGGRGFYQEGKEV